MRQRNRKQAEHRRFWQLLGLLLTLIFVRYALQIDLPRIVYLVLIFLIAALGDPSEIIAICLCCIPLHESVDFFYAVVICVAAYVVKNYRTFRIKGAVFILLLMVLWELLHCFGYAFSPMEFLVNIIPLLALAVFMCLDPREYDYDFVVRAISLTTAGLCVTLLGKVFYAANYDIGMAITGLQRLGMETSKQGLGAITGVVNPNTLGIICVLATTGLMQLRNAHRQRPSDLFLAMVLMVFGALTSSRTYLVCLAAMFMLLVLGQEGSVKQKLRFLGFVMLILAGALAALYVAFPDLLRYYFGRFLEADISTGRFDLMRDYHNFIVSDPKVLFFGIGLHDFGTKVLSVYRVTSHVPHNGIQELVVQWGLMGPVLFLALLLAMLFQSGKGKKWPKLIAMIPLLILLLKIQAGQLLSSAYTMLALCYAYLSLCQDFTPTDKGYSAFLPAPTPDKAARRGSKRNNKQSKQGGKES